MKRGPKTAEGKARSLANLKPVKPGEVLNPIGRPVAGASVREWFNIMQAWPMSEIEVVAKDNTAPANKRSAAVQWLESCEGNGQSLDRIFDRTIGKPMQAVELTGKDGGAMEINHGVDLSKLSADELRTWRELRLKASAGTDN